MKYCFFFMLIIISPSFANNNCEIKTYSHIYKINNLLGPGFLIKSNCSTKTIDNITQFLSGITGKLNARILMSNLSLNEKIDLKPAIINIHRIEDILNERLGSDIVSFTNINSLHGKSFISSSNQSPTIGLECKNCKTAGNKNIRFTTSNISTWISADLNKKVEGYKAKQTVAFMNPLLSSSDFKKVSLKTTSTKPLFTDIKNIRFYRLTRNLAPNDLLRISDLTPKTIVSRGQKVKVSVKNNTIKLNTIGKAMKSGKIGEFILIENPTSKRTSLAQIVDFNKVHIEL